MKAKVREHYNGHPRVMFGAPGEGMIVEIEITDPPSSKGRRIPVHLDAGMVDRLLLELRRSSAARRSAPICGSSR